MCADTDGIRPEAFGGLADSLGGVDVLDELDIRAYP